MTREVLIDGVRYVPAEEHPAEEAMKLLRDVYGSLWIEAYYDPTNEMTRRFAQPLADKMRDANKVLGFKD